MYSVVRVPKLALIELGALKSTARILKIIIIGKDWLELLKIIRKGSIYPFV